MSQARDTFRDSPESTILLLVNSVPPSSNSAVIDLLSLQEEDANEKLGWGKFIVLEGIDGSGTTTQAEEVLNHLLSKSERAFLTNEPSSGPAGMLIRLALAKRLLGPNYDFHDPREKIEGQSSTLDPVTLALLFAADRADHLATQVVPNLRRGRHVICDRYLLSTLAYQGLSLDLHWLLAINKNALRPDLTIYLDVPADKARVRMRHTRWAKDLYEDESHQQQIRRKYRELIGDCIPAVGPVVEIDSSRPKNVVTKEIIRRVDEFFQSGKVEEAVGELTLL